MNKLLIVLLIVACAGIAHSKRYRCQIPNMIHKDCGSLCPLTCENPDPQVCVEVCVIGCFCKDGYLLHNGICIRPDQSQSTENPCPNPNMEWNECGSLCEPSCGQEFLVCADVCVPKCSCGYGYTLDSNGNCIPPHECPTMTCTEPNTEYSQCGAVCEPTCRHPSPFCEGCFEGCICKAGYIRNDLAQTDSRECRDLHAIWSDCGSDCEPTCNEKPEFCSDVCIQKCVCEEGYVLDEDDVCILESDCPNSSQSDSNACPNPHMIWNDCGSACEPTCSEQPAGCIEMCISKCVCEEGYVLHEGACILKSDCPSQSKGQSDLSVCPNPHMIWNNCGSACEPTCFEQPDDCTKNCVPKCVCEEGYVLLEDDVCVLKSDCPNQSQPDPSLCSICPKPHMIWDECGSACEPTCGVQVDYSYSQQCGENMIYNECGSPCKLTCERPTRGICIQVCEKGCFCKAGYLLHDGVCIRPDQSKSAENPCPKPHMVWNECGSACEPSCEKQPEYCILICIAKCVCVDGYVLDSNGNCILPSLCPSDANNTTCTEPNTEYTPCGAACEPTCRYRRPRICPTYCVEGSQSDENPCPNPNMEWNECGSPCEPVCGEKPAICLTVCEPKCVCVKGYILDRNGNCILPNECPTAVNQITCTRPNTEYTQCGAVCEPTCSYPGRSCKDYCVEGCKCKEGYLRNDRGICVHSDQCLKNL
ncbi:keratin-associated protein 10-4-like [Chironomus tepperi]|uniref:keratin-associated protein 10-4-like n=1 Tax=Chironomus tepperi TaxID=113505 RepID=UPI00391FA76F